MSKIKYRKYITEYLKQFGISVLSMRMRKHLVIKVEHNNTRNREVVVVPASPSDIRAQRNFEAHVRRIARAQVA